MTPGHRHRVIRLRADGRLNVLLRYPLLQTSDAGRAERSRWVWGKESVGWVGPDGRSEFPPVYVLTALSILHTLFGVTVQVHTVNRSNH